MWLWILRFKYVWSTIVSFRICSFQQKLIWRKWRNFLISFNCLLTFAFWIWNFVDLLRLLLIRTKRFPSNPLLGILTDLEVTGILTVLKSYLSRSPLQSPQNHWNISQDFLRIFDSFDSSVRFLNFAVGHCIECRYVADVNCFILYGREFYNSS